MARQLRRLDPRASPLAEFGVRLRQHRLRKGLSLRSLGQAVHVSGSLIGKVELAQRRPGEKLAAQLDQILHADGELVTLASRLQTRPDPEADLAWTPPI